MPLVPYCRRHAAQLLAVAASLAVLVCAPSLRAQQLAAPAHAPSHFQEPAPLNFDDHTGFVQIFDGHSLADWEGDPEIWHVVDGAIVGESSAQKPVSNTYIWRKGLVIKNFDLKLEIKCEISGGSGIQYRSQTGLPFPRPLHPGEKPRNLDWMMTGPQADFWFPVNPMSASYSGQFYSENTPLGILAWRGEVVNSAKDLPPAVLASTGDRDELGGYIRTNDWNQYEIVARGGVMMHIINGHLMAVFIDDDPASSNNQPGKIGIELETTPARVSVRNIWIRKLQ